MNARRAYLHDRTTASAGERGPLPPPEPKVVGSNPAWRIELPRATSGGDNALAAAATPAVLPGLCAPYTHTPLVDGPQRAMHVPILRRPLEDVRFTGG